MIEAPVADVVLGFDETPYEVLEAAFESDTEVCIIGDAVGCPLPPLPFSD